jgi:flavin-binding protein dodecin
VSRAAQSLKNLRWCEVVQTRGHIEGGKVQHYQVALKIGFIVNDVRAA